MFALDNLSLPEYTTVTPGWMQGELYYDEDMQMANYQKRILAKIQAVGTAVVLSESSGSNKRNWAVLERFGSHHVLFNVHEETVATLVELGHLCYYVSKRKDEDFFYAFLSSNNDTPPSFIKLK